MYLRDILILQLGKTMKCSLKIKVYLQDWRVLNNRDDIIKSFAQKFLEKW